MGEHFQNYEILIISNNSSLENAKILEEFFSRSKYQNQVS